MYFDGDEVRAEGALEQASERRRQVLAYYVFTGAHLIMIIGVILVAEGITDAIHHFGGRVSPWWLGSGAAVFLIGHAIYRGLLKSGRVTDRLIAAACVVPLGVAASFAGWAAMAAVVVVLAVVGLLDHRSAVPRTGLQISARRTG